MPDDSKNSPRRRDVDAAYSYRRSLSLRELLPAVGAGVGVGVVVFYIARLLLQRTPIMVERRPRLRARARVADSSEE